RCSAATWTFACGSRRNRSSDGGAPMTRRWGVALFCLGVLGAAAWLGGAGQGKDKPPADWTEVTTGVWRSRELPAAHALLDGGAALLIDAPRRAAGLDKLGVKKVEAVLLTPPHRDTCAAAGAYLADRVPVRAAKASAEWLTPEGVRKYWQESLPLRNSRTANRGWPPGPAALICALTVGQTSACPGWGFQAVATPGPTPDHLASPARRGT